METVNPIERENERRRVSRARQEIHDQARMLLMAWASAQLGPEKAALPIIAHTGDVRIDDGRDFARVSYVESTEGFTAARRVVRWVWVEGREVEDYRLRLPGESDFDMLARTGLWVDYNRFLGPKARFSRWWARRAYSAFLRALVARLVSEPYRDPVRVVNSIYAAHDDDPAAIANEVTAAVEARRKRA